MWNNRARMDPKVGPAWHAGPHREYLQWYHASTRTRLKPAYTDAHIEDASSDSDDDIADEYDTFTRLGTQPERAPLNDYLDEQLARLANEAGVAMEHASAEEGGVLRQFAERVRRSCRRMAMKLNCMSAQDVAHGDNGQGTSSGSRRTPVHHGGGRISRTPSLTVSGSAAPGCASASRGRAIASRSRGKAIATTPEASVEEGGDRSSDSDYRSEIPMDQFFDSPPMPTQTQGESSQRAQHRRPRDHTDIGSANVVDTEPGRDRRPAQIFSPEDQIRAVVDLADYLCTMVLYV